MKRLCALFALLALLLSLLSGCAGTKDSDASGNTDDKTTTGDPDTGADTHDPDDTIGYDPDDYDDDNETEPFVPQAGEAGTCTEKAVYTDTTMSTGDPRMSEIVARCGELELTNSQFQVFYWMDVFGFLNEYSDYVSMFLDVYSPLYEQAALAENQSWEQFFVGESMDQFGQYAAVYNHAVKNGFTLSEADENSMNNILVGIRSQAIEEGYANADDYLRASFGPGVKIEDYDNWVQIYFVIMSYQNDQYSKVEYTDEDLEAYYEAHADAEEFADVDKDEKVIDVRHILIMPEDADGDDVSTDEEIAAAKAEAERILAEYEQDPTPENFAVLAGLYSQDPGSADNGGLYEGVTEGEMVEEFNDWCFDESRQIGDTGIVQTSYGFHIMYFAGSAPYWKEAARSAYVSARMDTLLTEIVEEFPVEADYGKIVLGPVSLVGDES